MQNCKLIHHSLMGFSHILPRHSRTLLNPTFSSLLQFLSHSTSIKPLKLQITQQNPPNLCKFQSQFLGFYRSIHGTTLTNTQVLELKEEPNSAQLIKYSEEICKLLSTSQDNSNIESVLETCGIDITPLLVSEVLNKLSNSGFLALSFFRWAERQDGFKHTTERFKSS